MGGKGGLDDSSPHQRGIAWVTFRFSVARVSPGQGLATRPHFG
jgi:hypothetical protein